MFHCATEKKTIGILDIQSDKRNAFTGDDRLIFEAVADNIKTAIHNADLYRSEQWRRQVADGLREVAGLISADAGVDDVFEAILSELDRNLPVDISAIWLLEDDELYLAACHNCDESRLEQALYDLGGLPAADGSAVCGISQDPKADGPDLDHRPGGRLRAGLLGTGSSFTRG